MGNNKLSAGCQIPTNSARSSPERGSQNGILGRVPGDLISRGMASLPDAAAPGPDAHEVIIDARHLGRVRLSIERRKVKHGRHSHYYWSAWFARSFLRQIADAFISHGKEHMCVNYAPVQRQVLRDIFGVEPPPSEWKPETWPKYAAPIIKRTESGIIRDGVDIGRECVIGLFGGAAVEYHQRTCRNDRSEAQFRPVLARWPALPNSGNRIL